MIERQEEGAPQIKRIKLWCGFCLRSEDQVESLIAGKSGNICNECVEVCCNILSERIERNCPTPNQTGDNHDSRQIPRE